MCCSANIVVAVIVVRIAGIILTNNAAACLVLQVNNLAAGFCSSLISSRFIFFNIQGLDCCSVLYLCQSLDCIRSNCCVSNILAQVHRTIGLRNQRLRGHHDLAGLGQSGLLFGLVNVPGQRGNQQGGQNAQNDQNNDQLYQRKAFLVLEGIANLVEHKHSSVLFFARRRPRTARRPGGHSVQDIKLLYFNNLRFASTHGKFVELLQELQDFSTFLPAIQRCAALLLHPRSVFRPRSAPAPAPNLRPIPCYIITPVPQRGAVRAAVLRFCAKSELCINLSAVPLHHKEESITIKLKS